VGVEVGFGFGVTETDEPLASPDPLVVDLGAGRLLRLHGRIDRINQLKPGAYEVLDYKTGGFYAPAWTGTFAGGTRLQHAIYGLAAADLLRAGDPKAKVVQGRYVFPAVKAHGRQVRIPAPARAAVVSVLRDLSDVLAAGVFVSAESDEACRFCEFAAACQAGSTKAAARKIAAADHEGLEAFRRLRGHA
jgi:RecB family exonuclease